MSKRICLPLAFLPLLLACNGDSVKKSGMIDSSNDTLSSIEKKQNVPIDTIPKYAQKIIKAYPDFCIKYEAGNLVFADGTTMPCDDGKEKSFVEKLDNCDIEDMFSMKYDTTAMEPSYLNDCGRGRCEDLFKKMYGSTEMAARKNLVSVEWFGQTISFSKVNVHQSN